MRKVFMYLNPTREEIEDSFDSEAEFHSSKKYKESYPKLIELLNKTVDVRYRKKGYEIVYVVGELEKVAESLKIAENDKVIKYNTPFKHGLGVNLYHDYYYDYYELFKQLGAVDELVVTGFRSEGEVTRAAKYAYDYMKIDTLIDLDLTERFFGLLDTSLYDEVYFQQDNYDPKRYKRMVSHIFDEEKGHRDMKENFQKRYGHPVYGFYGYKKGTK